MLWIDLHSLRFFQYSSPLRGKDKRSCMFPSQWKTFEDLPHGRSRNCMASGCRQKTVSSFHKIRSAFLQWSLRNTNFNATFSLSVLNALLKKLLSNLKVWAGYSEKFFEVSDCGSISFSEGDISTISASQPCRKSEIAKNSISHELCFCIVRVK